MLTADALIRELQKFPADARCYAYREGVGAPGYLVVMDGTEPFRELGQIPCDETGEDGPATVNPI